MSNSSVILVDQPGRVFVFAEQADKFDRLPYSGELDHLLSDDQDPFSEDADREAVFTQEDMDLVLGLQEPSLAVELEEPGLAFELTEPNQMLQTLAYQLRAMCDDACDWADRAENLAERAEELACV